jgi:hypothetical protein
MIKPGPITKGHLEARQALIDAMSEALRFAGKLVMVKVKYKDIRAAVDILREAMKHAPEPPPNVDTSFLEELKLLLNEMDIAYPPKGRKI